MPFLRQLRIRRECYHNSVKSHNDRAFKEWAAVVRALEGGETILVIRKGGIVEEGGAFRVNDPEFFLFPNHTHQNAAQLQPRAHAWLEASEADRPEEGTVRISSYAEVAGVWAIRDEATLARLDSEHLWSSDYVVDRFRYKPAEPLYAIALRVYRLPCPVSLPYLRTYAGCTSWVTLDAPLSTDGAIPALDGVVFAERVKRLERVLK
jgi:hypothetical protein